MSAVERMYRVVVIVLAAFLVSASADARSRVARPLEIRSADGNVLGCLPSDEGEAVEIDAAGVSSIMVDGRGFGKSWSIVLKDGHAPHRLQPGDCLAYGRLPYGYSEVAAPAELESEWPYSFGIRSP
ncbi:hypothetical protein H0E84_14200 [Luteimonas sp. SJ-92]|uniref:Uncharacterized protein n=1 Tax=Luteimonas salinisoli TaxID=2752307 RepID=A0A853JFJ5_9GAMM|nr:hypothetical protein [Luteimonas salinisoli]NZA27534.1 hypothetical protein [Luteimonas salinisoli]